MVATPEPLKIDPPKLTVSVEQSPIQPSTGSAQIPKRPQVT